MQDNKTFLSMLSNVLNTDGFLLLHGLWPDPHPAAPVQHQPGLPGDEPAGEGEQSKDWGMIMMAEERDRAVWRFSGRERSRAQQGAGFHQYHIQKAGQLIVSNGIPHLQSRAVTGLSLCKLDLQSSCFTSTLADMRAHTAISLIFCFYVFKERVCALHLCLAFDTVCNFAVVYPFS